MNLKLYPQWLWESTDKYWLKTRFVQVKYFRSTHFNKSSVSKPLLNFSRLRPGILPYVLCSLQIVRVGYPQLPFNSVPESLSINHSVAWSMFGRAGAAGARSGSEARQPGASWTMWHSATQLLSKAHNFDCDGCEPNMIVTANLPRHPNYEHQTNLFSYYYEF